LEEDFHGTSRMLDVLASLYEIPDELAPRRRGERQYRELDSAVDRNDELKGLIAQLETYYDSHYDTESSPEESSSGTSTPLPPEIERFLQGLDQQLDGPQN
jgi:hypothetical protein